MSPLQCVVLAAAAGLLSACDSVAMREPLTGAVETCQDGLRGVTPWSQTESCVADHEALGWTRVSQD
jgi:hypothetical protein